MKLLPFAIAVVSASVVAAGDSELSKEESRYRRTGGEIVRRGTYAGKIVFANSQSRLAASEVAGVCAEIGAELGVRMECAEVAERDPARLLREMAANAVLVVVDDPSAPTLLVAPEDRWAVVNVARLVDDLPGENAKRKTKI